ncbi:MAG: outer membrane protein assembly factor BamE [Pseudomonadota bacterium]
MKRFLILLPLLASLSACIVVYRPDVQQGNEVTAAQVAQLKQGMTRTQVRFVLGTPLISDPFHPDRWDYLYSLRLGRSSQVETRRVTVYFKSDVLERIEDRLSNATP